MEQNLILLNKYPILKELTVVELAHLRLEAKKSLDKDFLKEIDREFKLRDKKDLV